MEEEARAAPNRIVTTMNIRSCLGALVHAFLAFAGICLCAFGVNPHHNFEQVERAVTSVIQAICIDSASKAPIYMLSFKFRGPSPSSLRFVATAKGLPSQKCHAFTFSNADAHRCMFFRARPDEAVSGAHASRQNQLPLWHRRCDKLDAWVDDKLLDLKERPVSTETTSFGGMKRQKTITEVRTLHGFAPI